MNKITKSQIRVNNEYEATSLERTIEKMVTSNEPIEESVPMIYTEKASGVEPQYDIRTDRWEIAQEGMDKVTKSLIAKRDEKPSTETQVEQPKQQNNDSEN